MKLNEMERVWGASLASENVVEKEQDCAILD